jgi:hypothetical protein
MIVGIFVFYTIPALIKGYVMGRAALKGYVKGNEDKYSKILS